MYLNILRCKLIAMHVAAKDKNMPCKMFIMRGQAKVATIIGNKIYTTGITEIMVKVQGAKLMTLNQRKNDAHVMF